MARPKHPVTLRIEETLDQMERHGVDITPTTVKVNVAKAITWSDWTPEQASSEALDVRITRCMRDRGMVIISTATRTRKDFWSAARSELQEQLRIKEESSTYDRNRIKADRAVLTFLEAKEQELGYEPYPGLFHAEIDRIYSMHGLASPAA